MLGGPQALLFPSRKQDRTGSESVAGHGLEGPGCQGRDAKARTVLPGLLECFLSMEQLNRGPGEESVAAEPVKRNRAGGAACVCSKGAVGTAGSGMAQGIFFVVPSKSHPGT